MALMMWGGTEDDNLELAHESPCIDAGDSNSVPADVTTDLAGRERFTDDPVIADTGSGTPPIVDMGAYERYEFCGSEFYPYPPTDLSHDCHVNLADIAIIALDWLQYFGPE